MTTLDRYLLRALLINYAIALAVMMSLYVVLDLFVNVDEFTESGASIATIAADITLYYLTHSLLYFSQLSGVITLFACMATLARMRRDNELTAVLASGVSLYRLAAPVVAFGLCASLLWYVDVEFMVPRVAHLLARSHDDAAGRKSGGLWFVNDGPRDLLSAIRFVPAEGRMEKLLVLHRDEQGSVTAVTEAETAIWEEMSDHPAGGVWRLEGGRRVRRLATSSPLAPRGGLDFEPTETYESALGPDDLESRQSEQWIEYSSSLSLDELAKREPVLRERVRHARHRRFAAPLVHVLLLLLGLPFFLSREPANIITDAGKCLAVCGSCYALSFAGEHFIRAGSLSALPSWLPLIVFAPVAVVLNDRIRT